MTTNVFIVDDSATARTALRLILETSDEFNVTGVASNPLIALKRMHSNWPDVIISDLEMPEMHGFEFLAYIQKNRPTPFIVFSNYTGTSAMSSVEALSKGAADIIPKPKFNNPESLEQASEQILASVRAAASVRSDYVDEIKLPLDEIDSSVEPEARSKERAGTSTEISDVELPQTEYSVIAIGSSTGGTTIIEKILRSMPVNSPGIVIVQHMPAHFTKAFANRINQFCKIEVKEAEDGMDIKPGQALIAPGGKHMAIKGGRLGRYKVSIFEGEYVNRHCPSVDVLFNSVAETVRKDAVGVILTGMGKDGAKGLLAMKKVGAYTLGQCEEDCAVLWYAKSS